MPARIATCNDIAIPNNRAVDSRSNIRREVLTAVTKRISDPRPTNSVQNPIIENARNHPYAKIAEGIQPNAFTHGFGYLLVRNITPTKTRAIDPDNAMPPR
jgi:hypothetical protein